MTLHLSHRKGIRAELIAQEYFLEKGYLVFSALRGIGPIDFITLDKDNNIRYFDVKTRGRRSDNTKICRSNKRIPGIRIEILYVDLESKEITTGLTKKAWHKKYKFDRDKKGQYNGKVIER